MYFIISRIIVPAVFLSLWLYLRKGLRKHVLWGSFLTPPVLLTIDAILFLIVFFRYITKIPLKAFNQEPFHSVFELGYMSMTFFGTILGALVVVDIYELIKKLKSKNEPETDHSRRKMFKAAGIGATGVLTSSVGVSQALTPLIIEQDINFENIPSDLDGLKIVQLSDIHIGPFLDETYVEYLTKTVNELNPDLVFLTGDLIDGHMKLMSWMLEDFKNLNPKYGTYMCTGNHEYYWNAPEWISFWPNLGVKTLINSGSTIQIGNSKLGIAGVTDPAAKRLGKEHMPNFEVSSQAINDCDFKILLCHRPKLADKASQYEFDLQFSGHTHGGQSYPLVPIVSMVQKYLKGLHQVDAMKLYVSAGVGFWGPPIRVGVPAEINVITLKSRGTSQTS